MCRASAHDSRVRVRECGSSRSAGDRILARPRISTPAVAGQAWRMLNRPDMAASPPHTPALPANPACSTAKQGLLPHGRSEQANLASVGNSPRRQTTRLASLAAAAPVRTMHAPWATESPARCAQFWARSEARSAPRFCETCAALPMRNSDSTRATRHTGVNTRRVAVTKADVSDTPQTTPPRPPNNARTVATRHSRRASAPCPTAFPAASHQPATNISHPALSAARICYGHASLRPASGQVAKKRRAKSESSTKGNPAPREAGVERAAHEQSA